MKKLGKKIGAIFSMILLASLMTLGVATLPASAETVTDGTLTLTNTGSWPGGLGRHNVHHTTYVEVADTEDLVIEYEILSATENMARFGLVKGLQDVTDEMKNYDAYLEMVLHNGSHVYSGFCMPGATEMNTYSTRSAAVQEYMLANGSASYNASDASYGLNYHTSGWGANLGSKQGMATADVKYKHIYGADGHFELWIYNTSYPTGKKVMYTAPTFASSANQRTGITLPDAIQANDEKIFVNRSGYIGFWANHDTYNLEIDNFKVSVIDANGNETVKINETYDYTTGGSEYDTSNWVYTKSGSSTWNCDVPEEIVYAEASALAIQAGLNHSGSSEKTLVIYAQDASNASITLDYTYPEGNFASSLLLNGEATDKFTFKSSGGHSASGSAPIHLTYANDDTLFATTSESYLTLTIPQGTTLYNIAFAEDLNLYFYNGAWQLTKPAIVTEYESANGVLVQANNNHLDKWGHKYSLLQFTKDGTAVAMDKTVNIGNFFTNATIEINGTTTSIADSQFTFQDTNQGHGDTYFDILYALNGSWVDPAEGEMYTLTIPAGTTAYDVKFTSEAKLYFYNGAWQTVALPETTEAYSLAIQANLNHTGSSEKTLVIYAYDSSSASIKLNYASPAGTFNTNLLLNGEATDKFTFKSSGGHSASGSSPIHLVYANDDTLFATTTESYLTLTIPQGTMLYNIKFAQDLNLYFYNGVWQTTEPTVAVYQEVNGVTIQAGWNHVSKYGGMYTLLKWTKDDTVISMDKSYAVGSFFENATIEISGVTTAINASQFAFKSYNAGHGNTYFDVLYCTSSAWVNPADGQMYTLTIPVGTTAYNVKFTTEVKLYFIDGQWQLTDPNLAEEFQTVNGVSVQADNNHIDKWGHKYSLLQFTKDGTAVAMDKTVYLGNFFKNATITLNGATTSIATSQFTFQKEDQKHGDKYFDILYALNGSWVDPADGDMYVLTIPAGTTAHDVKFETEVNLYFYNGAWQTEPLLNSVMTAGASIRIDMGNATRSGIKFQGNVSKTIIDYLTAQKTSGAIDEVVYGTIITAKDLLDKADITDPTIANMDKKGIYYKNIVASGFNSACETETTKGFYASLVGIQSSNYYRTWVARSYIAVTVDGVTTYYWADYNETDNARSVYETAKALYNGDFYNSLDADAKAVIDSYIDGVVDITYLKDYDMVVYVGQLDGYTEPYTFTLSGNELTISSTAYIHTLVIDGVAVALNSLSADGKTATYILSANLNSGEDLFIGGFAAPDVTADQDAAYQAVADAGITHLIIFPTDNSPITSAKFNTDPFVYGEKYGIKIIPFTANLQSDFSPYYAKWMQYESFGGVLAYDEPTGTNSTELATVKASIQSWVEGYTAACPNVPYYINLLPNYAESTQIGGMTYENYVAYFSDVLYAPTAEGAGIWCDIYPLKQNSIGSYVYGYELTDTWLSNLETLRAEADENNTDLYMFIQTIDYDNRRLPDEAEIRFQAYTSMAYGAAGITYFCYQTPYWATTFEGSTGAIDTSGAQTEIYDAIQNVSAELELFDQAYLAFDWKAVISSGSCNNFNNCSNMQTAYGHLKGVSSTSESIVGCFENEDGYQAFMAVNFIDPHNEKVNTITLTLDSKIKSVIIYDDGVKKIVEVENGKLELTLDAGEGQFIVPYEFAE